MSVEVPADVGSRPAASGMGPSFWRLFASSSTSNLSDGVMQAALPLLAATLTRDPVAVSALASLAFLPWLLFAMPAGVLVDRVNRRAAMAVANVVRAGLLAVLATTVVLDVANLPILYGLAFLLGTAETVYDNAARAMLPAVVPRRKLERGNSLLGTAESVGQIFLGAPIGAWLFALAVSLPLWANTGAYLLAALLALTVAGSFRTVREHQTSMREDLVEGLRWLLRHPFLRPLMAVTLFGALFHSMTTGILVLFALEELGFDERGFGLMLAAAGLGAVVGSLVSPYVTSLLGRTTAMGLTQLLSALAVMVMGLWRDPVVGTACFAVSAGTISMFNVQVMSVRQALIPAHLFGRVQGAYRTAIWGGIPLGSLLGGAVGSWWGLPAAFVTSGVLGAVVALATWAVLHRWQDMVSDAFAHDPVD